MIRFNGICKNFGATRALDNFSLEIGRGLVYGLIGPNGAGKTTAMSILATLLLPDAGTATVDGLDVVRDAAEVRGRIGYMPDFFGVYDGLRATEYLEFFAAAHHIPAHRRPGLARTLLELVNLPDKADVYVDSLSRGMKQRLSLARCLVHDPRVLILDEPASGLDPRARAEMKEIIRHLKHLGKTVLISSHILPELAEICDQVAIMEKGRLVVAGTVAEITAVSRGARPMRVAVLDRAEELAGFLATRPGVSETLADGQEVRFLFDGSRTEQAALLQAMVSGGWPVVEFTEVRRNLEEAFMAVTAEGVEDHGGN
ncbi:ATP-binding cassette domain-containing protein [Desulfofundulus thermobenzoicus]|uniref:ATP-binding cassette domain-containing protein n=1 Tax=Desulfofundulus thermobenzoicus TaxID=29376 RepID=A0A6N7ISI0_9FIRM|nr:ABC transporter ATP-binding protein [Desulfofundulus thermobenzoicus]MQL53012.1 ATP-binding cassette domain-containing protein [Desulfofundulus thermobenzoicus]HHW43973.1 ABC transporter ATP-binding protein [Desulfotomaculum sp.]